MAKLDALKALVEALSRMANEIVEIAEDGKLDYKDITNVVISLKELASISAIDFKAVAADLAGLNDEESEQIKQAIRDAFEIENKVAEELIEQLLSGVVHLIVASEEVYDCSLKLKDIMPA